MISERLDVVTVDDVVRAGACREGVENLRDQLAPLATAVDPDKLFPNLAGNDRRLLLLASGRSGDGDGYGDGSGDGYGYGDGDGYGDGYGYGDGSGDGYGDGYGYGYGYGYGSGDGSGSGYGYGYGHDAWSAASLASFRAWAQENLE